MSQKHPAYVGYKSAFDALCCGNFKPKFKQNCPKFNPTAKLLAAQNPNDPTTCATGFLYLSSLEASANATNATNAGYYHSQVAYYQNVFNTGCCGIQPTKP